MNAHTLAQRAYSQSASSTRTSRATEYEIIARVTHRIKHAAMRGKGAFGDLASALHDNRKLWTALAVDVSDSDNGLDADLRARVFYLSEFTQKHTSLVLAGRAGVGPLLEINTAILRGLSARGANR